jgi:hypothetical protein
MGMLAEKSQSKFLASSGRWCKVLRGPVDHAAAETDLAVVEHHVLARSDRTLRLVESHMTAAVGE